MSVRQVFQKVTTPTVRRWIKRGLYHPPLYRRFKHLIEYEYMPQGWAAHDTDPAIKGWDVQSIIDIYKEKWPAFVRQVQATDPLGVAHEASLKSNTDFIAHNTMLCYAYALLKASSGKKQLSILDWGGGIGHYYLISKSIVPEVTIDYHCKDLPLFVEHGRTLFPEATFYTDESCFERQYDLILVSGALHYTREWQSLMQRMARATRGHLFVTRLPTVEQVPSYVYVQRPYSYGYNTEYLGWCMNRAEVLRCGEEAGLTFVREFVTAEAPFVDRAPEQPLFRGFLWQAPAGAAA